MDIDNLASGQDATGIGSSTLTFTVTTSLQDELDAFVRYSRLGFFQKAQEVYGDVLNDQFDTLFPVTAELADSLLEQGNFRRLYALLKNRLNRATELGFDEGQVGFLRLLKALTDLHRYGDLRNALEVARSWREAAAFSMGPDTLSIVDKLSLGAYLRIVTIAFKTSNWLRPQDMQPPWESNGTQSWSGFCELFEAMSGDPDDAWNARNLFRPLITSLTSDEGDALYSASRSKRKEAAPETNEESLLADLSITTTYVRQLIASADPDDRLHVQNRISQLIDNSQEPLDQLTTLVGEVDDVTGIRMRPALDLDLAKLENWKATAKGSNIRRYYSFQDKCKQIWLLARKNYDLVTQTDSLHLQRLNMALGDLSEREIPETLSDRSGDMLGYVTATTHRILSIFQVATRSAPSPSPKSEGTKLDFAAREDLKGGLSYTLNLPWAIESFEMWLDSSTMTTPLVLFMGSVVRLILAELLDEKWDVATTQERILKVSHNIQWPLHCMVGTGYLGGVQLLLQYGVPPNTKDYYGMTPLMKAMEGQSIAMVRLLLGSGANINAGDIGTTLRLAATKGHEEVVRLIRDMRAEVDVLNINGRTPLSHAAEQGHAAVVQLLLEMGAEVDRSDINGRPPLSHAAEQGHSAVVQLLLEMGAEANAKDDNGMTALSLATEKGYKEVVRLLLSHGADINAKDGNDMTALSLATKKGYIEVVRLLFSQGADINAKDTNGMTALSLATEKGYMELVRLLLRMGADINAKDGNNMTPLLLATEKGYWAMAKMLVHSGADIHAKGGNGMTALSLATKSEHQPVVTLLLSRGAYIDKKHGDTDAVQEGSVSTLPSRRGMPAQKGDKM